ncbi:MAG TPA: hypothetical protein DDZ22_03840, partial [Massilia sp.]|nr:hypothetical protein [Massilia sp.]
MFMDSCGDRWVRGRQAAYKQEEKSRYAEQQEIDAHVILLEAWPAMPGAAMQARPVIDGIAPCALRLEPIPLGNESLLARLESGGG